jgi:asparagine synthase (glutamine-hydrolysing)
MEETVRAIEARALAAGVQARFPFFDVRLIEYCLSLPGDLKCRDGWTRWIERAAMKDILPEAVRWRQQKTNMAISYRNGLKTHERQALTSLAAAVSNERSPVCKYLNPEAISTLATRVAEGEELESSGEEVLLWRAFALHEWCSLRRSTPMQQDTAHSV